MRDVLPTRRIVNGFGAIGYSLLIIVYAIMVGVGLLWLVQGGHLTIIGVPSEISGTDTISTADPDPSSPSIIMSIITYTVTAIMLVTVVFVMVSLPYWLGKTGSYLIRRAIELGRWPITPASLLIAKIIACGVAAVPIFILTIQDVNNAVVLLAVSAMIVASTLAFLLQHYLAKASDIPVDQIW